MSPVVKASLKERPLSFNKTIAKLQISDLEIQIRVPSNFVIFKCILLNNWHDYLKLNRV